MALAIVSYLLNTFKFLVKVFIKAIDAIRVFYD